MEELTKKLMAIRELTNKKDNTVKRQHNTVYIEKTPESHIYCQMALDLAIDLKEYMVTLEVKIKNKDLDPEEAKNLQHFLEELSEFIGNTVFLGGARNQTWVTAGFLLFGTIVYHKALLRLQPKTIDLFFLEELLQEVETKIYNNIYYGLQ